MLNLDLKYRRKSSNEEYASPSFLAELFVPMTIKPNPKAREWSLQITIFMVEKQKWAVIQYSDCI